jgi:cation diffusion facilitator family transporter
LLLACHSWYSATAYSTTFIPTRRNNNLIPITTGTNRLSYSTRRSRSSSLSMHMGHSHAHHDHHHKHAEASSTPPKTLGGHVLRVSRRPTARLVFAALVVFVPALLRRVNRGVTMTQLVKRSDIAAFMLISAALSGADAIRREFQRIVTRVSDWREGFLKHAPPALTAPSAGKLLGEFGGGGGTNTHDDTSTSSTATELSSSSSAEQYREQAADRVTLLGVLVNVVLSVGKLAVGVTCHSSALIADAGHSLSDLFSDFITLYAVQIARLPPDDDHPYGHGKFEAVGALFLALTLLGTGLSVGAVSNAQLMEIIKTQRRAGAAAVVGTIQVPTFPALIMAFLSIASKEWLYRITRRVGEDLNSQVVLANAWHHRSDAYSSVLALVSIALAMLVPGLLAADSAAGLLVGGMICMTGAEIMGEAVKQLTDASADDDLVETVKQVALQESNDVLAVPRIRTRQMGSKVIVDVSITTPDSLSNSATKAVEERVKLRILKTEPNVIIDADVHATSVSVASREATGTTISSGEAAAATAAVGDQQDPQDDDHDHDHSHSHSHSAPEASTSSEDDSDVLASTALQINGVDSLDSLEGNAAKDTLSSSDDITELSIEEHDNDDSDGHVVTSFQLVEEDARQLLNDHASVKSVEGCTVHYDEPSQEVQVDVTIKLENPDWTTVTIATNLAKELRTVLEEGSSNIHKANIFLDLNGPTQPSAAEEKEDLTDPSEIIEVASVNGIMAPDASNNTIATTPQIPR